MEIAIIGELEALREELIKRGFIQSANDSVVCRFRYEDVLVDVMSTIPVGWAPGNRWFELGFDQALHYDLEELLIKLLPLPYFLATKFDAFFDRGIRDLYASHDFEDIVYLLNHVSDLADQVANSKKTVKEYLIACASKIMKSSQLQEAIIGNLFHEAQDQRFGLIMSKLKNITNGI